MRGAILPLPQHAFMTWCSVKRKAQGKLLPLPLPVQNLLTVELLHWKCSI
jgi:hypothetical protein